MSKSLPEYLRELADWIHHEAFHKLPDELEEKADEVRELAQTLEAGVVVVPAEHLPDPEKLRRIADAIDRLWPYETDPRGPGDLRRWADNMDAVLQHSAGRTRPAGGCSVTLTDDERQIVCEALQAFAEHAEWQAGQQCPDAQEWSGAMASARALLARLQRSGGEGR